MYFLTPDKIITADIYCLETDKMYQNYNLFTEQWLAEKDQFLLHDNTWPLFLQMTAGIERLSTYPTHSPNLLSNLQKLFQTSRQLFNNRVKGQNAFKEFVGSTTPEFCYRNK